jgi:hypothetical protein
MDHWRVWLDYKSLESEAGGAGEHVSAAVKLEVAATSVVTWVVLSGLSYARNGRGFRTLKKSLGTAIYDPR